MSLQTRAAIATSPHILYRTPQQRDDIVSVRGVRTQLVAFLQYLVQNRLCIEVTALMSVHHNDLSLNPFAPHCGTHAGGWAVDCWPLTRPEFGAYLDAQDKRFSYFLEVARAAPWLYQIGLAGSAYTPENIAAAGSLVFADEGADHIHFGVHQ
jgi:hypothetical protein